MANVLGDDERAVVVAALADGNSIRAIERQTGIHRDTIMRLGYRVGSECQRILDEKMKNLVCKELQCDEIWGFIGKKAKNVTKYDPKTRVGNIWTFVAIDAPTKLVPCFRVGKRDARTANAFMIDLASRLVNRVQISTAALRAYIDAVERGFGGEVEYAQIVKSYSPSQDDQAGEYVKRRFSQVSVNEHAGRWYVCILGPDIAEAPPNGGSNVGIDVGVVRLATLSDGTVIENPKALVRCWHKVERVQKEMSRKKRGSRNRSKAKARLARVHARAANVRKDALHKASTLLAKSHGRIVIEDLSVRNMTSSANGCGKVAKAGLNRSLLDASFAEFRRQLEYKAKLYGCRLVVVPAAYTSQRCSVCGRVEAGNRISQSEFRCLGCGHTANADLNAAINILVAGSCPETQNACGAGVRRDDRKIVSQSVMKQESA